MADRVWPIALFFAALATSTTSPAQPERGAAALTEAQQQRLSPLILADPRIRRITGSADARLHFGAVEFEKGAADAVLAGSARQPPQPEVSVLAVSASGAARARVSLDGRLLAVEPIPASDLPFFDEDVARALALAQRGENVRAALGPSLSRFEPARAGQEYPPDAYIAEPLPVRSSDPRDPCSRDRCLDLVFRTPAGYLPVRVQVNLTRGTATAVRPIQEHHR